MSKERETAGTFSYASPQGSLMESREREVVRAGDGQRDLFLCIRKFRSRHCAHTDEQLELHAVSTRSLLLSSSVDRQSFSHYRVGRAQCGLEFPATGRELLASMPLSC